jgi:WD40 repeat protein
LASSEWDNAIRLWEPNSGNCLHVLEHTDDASNFYFGVAWSPDGQRLAAGTHRHGVQVFNMTADYHTSNPHPVPAWIRHVAWSPDATQVAGGGDDGAIYVWDTVEGRLLKQLVGHYSRITNVAWNPAGHWLASGASGNIGGELFVWEMPAGALIHTFAGHPETVSAVAWGDNQLISGSTDGILRWWDVRSGECVRQQEAHQGTITSLRRSPAKDKLASCGNDGNIMIWNLHTGEYLQTLRRDRPYERLNISGIQGLSDVQKATLYSLGAIDP